MNKSVRLEQIYNVMAEKLDGGGEVVFNPHGVSMMPILRNDGDRVIIKKPKGRLEKYDIAFYRRKNGQFVLHRVIRRNESGYDMCGDNQGYIEKNVEENQIIAYVTGIYRRDKYIDCDNRIYRIYSRIWVKMRFLRKIRDKIRITAGKIKRKTIKK